MGLKGGVDDGNEKGSDDDKARHEGHHSAAHGDAKRETWGGEIERTYVTNTKLLENSKKVLHCESILMFQKLYQIAADSGQSDSSLIFLKE